MGTKQDVKSDDKETNCDFSAPWNQEGHTLYADHQTDLMKSGLSNEDLKSLPVKHVKSTVLDMINDVTTLTPITEIEDIVKCILSLKNDIEREQLLSVLAKTAKVPVRSLRQIIVKLSDGATAAGAADTEEFITSANFGGLIDIGIDHRGQTMFLLRGKDKILAVSHFADGHITYVPPGASKLPFMLPRVDNVLKYIENDSDNALFTDIAAYLTQYSSVNGSDRIILVCYAFLTYIYDHPDISYIPEILFFAVAARGKSRTARALINLTFRGIHTIEFREANILRFAQDLKATLCFDVSELWRKVSENRCEDVLLGRFEKGHKVARVLKPEAGPFDDMVYFDVFGATLLVSNEPIHKILGTRCISITMPNSPGRYKNLKPADALELKERLTAWRARVFNCELPAVDPVPGLEGRMWIFHNLFCRSAKWFNRLDSRIYWSRLKMSQSKGGMMIGKL